MFYKQSITDIEVVVLTLDGGLLDLNRLRYNYFKRLCKHYDEDLSKAEFSEVLGNMNEMYRRSPIKEHIANTELNQLIEKELFTYAKLKLDIVKDGVEELLQFFIQRKMKVVVVSTHKTKRAIQYLQLTKLHKYVDFVVGGDSDCTPLPDPAILDLISYQMGTATENILVVANFKSMVTAANKKLMNIVYLPDILPATSSIEASVYRVAKNPLEIINLFLFAKYDTVEIFSPLLGMSANMDIDTLHKTYRQLLREYADDESLTRLVKQTYQYFLTEIQDKEIRGNHVFEPVEETFQELEVKEESLVEKLRSVELNPVSLNESETIEPEIKFETPKVNDSDTNINSNVKQAMEKQKDFVTQATSLNLMMDAINEKGESTVSKEIEEPVKEIEEETGLLKVWNYTIDFLYTTMLSVIVVLVGMICYIIGGDFLKSKGVLSSIASSVVNGYVGFIIMVYRLIFNGVHSILSFIPDYETLLVSVPIVSKTGMETILYIIFHIGLIYIFRWIWNIIKDEEE